MYSDNFHAGNPETSYRLRRVLNSLKEAGKDGLTSWQIVQKASVVSPATCVSELRKNGFIVDCELERTMSGGSRIYRYIFKGKKEKANG
jgi:hypothetical protein